MEDLLNILCGSTHVFNLKMYQIQENQDICRKLEMTLEYQQKTYNKCIYFEQNITCLNLIDKYRYFPTLQLYSLNKGK